MKKLLIINVAANTTSTGRIAEQIGLIANNRGYHSYLAYGRSVNNSKCDLLKIGSKWNVYSHGFQSLFFDNHGFGSKKATEELIRKVEQIKPDIVNLHNLHGYYINIEILFKYLAKSNIPVVWTLHDCWSFTGHCSYFDLHNCMKWKTGCHDCPNYKGYPKSLFFDCSKRNYQHKKDVFCSVENLTFVTPSNWLKELVEESYLRKYPVKVIHNGIDLEMFKPMDNTEQIKQKYGLQNSKIILGVGNVWGAGKGMNDFIKLRSLLCEGYKIVLVGLTDNLIKDLPDGIVGIKRTENVLELASLYSAADVFVNPTYVDNFPTTNIEALACGTPVVTYQTGGSPEAIDEKIGLVADRGDINMLSSYIQRIVQNRSEFAANCRARAVENYNMKDRFEDYVNLFDALTCK